MNGTETVIQNVGLDFTVQLFATLIGAFVGFGLAIFWEWKAKHTELKNIKIKILDSFLAELQQIKGVEQTWKKLRWDEKTRQFAGNHSTDSFASFDTALHSGNIVHFSLELQIKLSLLNDEILREQFFVKEMLTFHKYKFLKNDELSTEANRLINNFKIVETSIEDDLNTIIPLIRAEIEKLK